MAGNQRCGYIQKLDTTCHAQSQHPDRRYNSTANPLSAVCDGQSQRQHQHRSGYEPAAPIEQLLTPAGTYIPPESRPPCSAPTVYFSTSLQTEVDNRDPRQSIESCHLYEHNARAQHATCCKLPYPTLLSIPSLPSPLELLRQGGFNSITSTGYTTSSEPSTTSFQRSKDLKEGPVIGLSSPIRHDSVAAGPDLRRHAWSTGSTQHVPQKRHLKYELRVRQQPLAARACGYGERDRGVIDPPPIVQLLITDRRTGAIEHEEMQYSLNALHCTLLDANKGRDETAPGELGQRTCLKLTGQRVATPVIAKDEYDNEGCFFCYPDLSCRVQGPYRLRFVLICVNPANLHVGGSSPIMAEVTSDVFTVYTPKEFPGMQSSSALTRVLKLQGCNIQLRKGNGKTEAGRELHVSQEHDRVICR